MVEVRIILYSFPLSLITPIGDSESYSCRFANATSPFVVIENDDTVPDVVDGVLVSPYVSIPVLNTQQGSFLTGLTASIIGEDFGMRGIGGVEVF